MRGPSCSTGSARWRSWRRVRLHRCDARRRSICFRGAGGPGADRAAWWQPARRGGRGEADACPRVVGCVASDAPTMRQPVETVPAQRLSARLEERYGAPARRRVPSLRTRRRVLPEARVGHPSAESATSTRSPGRASTPRPYPRVADGYTRMGLGPSTNRGSPKAPIISSNRARSATDIDSNFFSPSRASASDVK